ncbi:DEAD/DEAH box helicase [Stutzerimonas stutzeri]|uniref:DEAD/DEAH box helicase n=1 Tax=Stutzerimonas stutzeri TaxID=316 RepID=UPI003D04ED91
MKSIKVLSGNIALENNFAETIVFQELSKALKDEDLYLSYKFPGLGKSNDQIPSFTIVSKSYGIIIVDVIDEEIVDVDDDYWITSANKQIASRDQLVENHADDVHNRLKRNPRIYNKKTKELIIPIRKVIVFFAQNCAKPEISTELFFSDCIFSNSNPKLLIEYIQALEKKNIDNTLIDSAISLLDGTDVFEKKNSPKDLDAEGTIGGIIRKSLDVTFKQDDIQRVISYQIPNGPQRIRGLAGTGKTVVLSLKAAFTHKNNKDFKILYVFNTQSLYGIVQNHITKYYMREAQEMPDFDNKVDVLHAWGGATKNGLYKKLCDHAGMRALTFNEVKGRGEGLAIIYRHILSSIDRIEPIYDLVLIDEAQDFPVEFFETIFRITKDPKRIVWAYDEFQTLRDGSIKEPEELFGSSEHGPNIRNEALDGVYPGDIEKDFVLSNCYRTPRPVLMTAHGVALALYSPSGAIQMFDHKSDWDALGYRVITPEESVFKPGDKIELERPDEFSKNLLEQIIKDDGDDPKELIQLIKCKEYAEQFSSVANEAEKLIKQGGVKPEDILVVDLDTRTSKDDFLSLRKELSDRGIKSISPGFIESADVFGIENHITLATPFRAKGNESNIVFVLNSHKTISDATLRARNSFFIAVTRSRGWCYLVGGGTAMDALEFEINKIKADYPRFKFTRPTTEKLKARKQLLSKTDKELELIEKITKDPDLLLEILSRDPSALALLKERMNNE